MKALDILSLAILTFLMFQSCEKDVIEQKETETTVVEAYLYAGQTIDSLKITQSFSYGQEGEGVISINDLDITISDDENQTLLTPIGDGFYNNPDFVIEEGESYRLEFERDGEIISAETYVPERNVTSISTTQVELVQIKAGTFPIGGINIPDPVEVSWNNEDGDYYYISIKNIESDPEYVNENIGALDRQFAFITAPQISDFYAIRTRQELTQYGTYQIIVFRVNPEYAALYASSGNSTLSLEEPPSNIVNGLGIFTGVSSDTLYLEVTKI